MKSGSFFAELKRRNVYKVAVAYAVVSWLLVQAASIVPTFEAPAWTMKVLLVGLSVFFPIAIVFAWAFEFTPEGIRLEKDIEPRKSITAHTGRKLVGLTIVLAVMAASLLVFQLLRSKASVTPRAVADESQRDKQNAAGEDSRTTAGLSAISDKSIAVLPFDNLSDEKSNAYFAEGIQDEILTRLSKIAALKVISRTSTKKFQSAPDNLREVGKQLGVAHVLEGSVQKIANAVHVNVQLIRASTDEHLWAESYNRKLDDVFGVEGEVAGAIAEQLNAKLTGAEQKAISAKPTENVEAYDAYLRGLSIEHDRYTFAAYQEAAAAYARAVQVDSKFALAWARLAVIRSFLFFNGVDLKANSAEAVKDAADRAIAIQPDLAEAWVAQGAYRYRVLRDYPAALQGYDEARKRLPNSSLVFSYMAFVERRLGRWKEAEINYRRAIELAPRDLQLFVSFGGELLPYLKRFDEAQAALDHGLEFAPNDESLLANKAAVYQSDGKWDEAGQALARIPASSGDDFTITIKANQAAKEGRLDEAIAILHGKTTSTRPDVSLDATTKGALVFLAFCQEWAGRLAEAKATFARAVQAIKPSADFVVSPDSQGTPYALALAYGGLGDKEKALAQAKRAVADYAGDAVNLPSAEIVLAQMQPRFGDLDAAMASLPHLLEVPAGLTRAQLLSDNLWNPLRKDPRFQKLCQEKNS